MANLTEQQIDEFIQFINDTEEPESVTNSIVAAVLAFIANKIKTMATTEDIASVLNTIAAYFSDGKLRDGAIPTIVVTKNGAGEIGYGTMPALVLNRIDQTMPAIGVAGQTCFCSDGKIRRYYTAASGGMQYVDSIEYNPSKKFPYYNLADGKFYIWNGDGMEEIPGSGYEVINDLLTGGEEDALSAEMGKKLGEMMEDAVSVYVKGETLYIRSVLLPDVGIMPSSFEYEDTIYGNQSVAVFHVVGRKLKHEVHVDVSGVGFSGSTTLYPDANGKISQDVLVYFNPRENIGVEAGLQGFREYTGAVTISCEGVSPVTAAIQGYGMQNMTPRVTASLEKSLLKGVLNSTSEGDYSGAPAETILSLKVYNNSDTLTLSVDSDKFVLGDGQSSVQVSAEEAARGKEIAVAYNRQSAATETDDEAVISITNESNTVLETVIVKGSTRAKITGGNTVIGTFDNITYKYNSGGDGILCSNSGATGDLVIPDFFCDDYGYKYIPTAIADYGFKESNITSVDIPANITTIYAQAFYACPNLRKAKVQRTGSDSIRREMFAACPVLKEFDCVFIPFGYQQSGNSLKYFNGSDKIERVVIRSLTDTPAANTGNSLKIRDEDIFTPMGDITVEVAGVETTLTDVYYYTDINGVKHQKKLYVPSTYKSAYEANAIWNKFEIHELSELTD